MTAVIEPLLDVHDIQGNILAGFNKNFQFLVGLAIDDVAAAKRWLSAIQGHVSSTSEVLLFNRLFRLVRSRTKREPMGLAATWFNIAFSHGGILKLTTPEEADALPDDAFQKGMPARSTAILGDPVDPASPFHTSHWKIGGPGNVPDMLLIIASDGESTAREMLQSVLAADGATGLRGLYTELGTVRPDLPGHEHFGFKDGISQPGVRGIVSRRPDDFLTPRLLDMRDPLSAQFSRPGQPLVMPGHYVLGYGTQDSATGDPLDPPLLTHTWFRNGSFLVFRRLRQDVAAFRAFVAKAAEVLKTRPSLGHMSADLLAAIFVGRWPNGAPLTRSPTSANPAMATELAANAFAFANAMVPVLLKRGVTPDATPLAPADALAEVCPHWAHIRKINPRDDQTNLGDSFDTLVRRLFRRGIPYGPPIAVEATEDDGVDRGLLFLAYHASLEQSFEKLTSDWANQIDNPSPRGHDPIIGQTNAGGSRARVISLPNRGGQTVEMPIDREWVLPTGGGYFFAPSVSAIAERLARLSR